MSAIKTVLAMFGFVVLYCFIDWFAGVTAPVLGPIVLVGAIGALLRIVWKLSR